MAPWKGFEDRPLIAVLDHDPDIREACCRLLERHGYFTIRADSVADARRVLETYGPDGILTAPLQSSGAEIVRILRRRVSARHVPILFWSASLDDRLEEEALEAGADRCRHKTASPLGLCLLLRSLVPHDRD